MRRWLWLPLLGSLLSGQTVDDFFDDSTVRDVRLTIRPSDWQSLKANFILNTYYPAEFSWSFQGRDIRLADVGVRSRGRGSRSPVKPNLRVDLDRYEENQQYLGLKSFTLKANNQEATQLVERVVFRLFARMGLPASRQAHVRLFVNGTYEGVFLLTEEVRKEYLKTYLGEEDGYLYEWEPFEDRQYHFEYLGSDLTKYSPQPFDPVTNERNPDPRPLEAFLRFINQSSDAEFQQRIGEYLDLKLFFTHVALENYASETDGMLGDVLGANNFYFYRWQQSTRNQFLVWDKDLSFNGIPRSIWHHTERNVITRRALAAPGGRDQYLEAVHKSLVLAGGAGGWLEWMFNRFRTQTEAYVRADPNKRYAKDGVDLPATNEVVEEKVAAARELIRGRYLFVRDELFGTGYRPSGPLLAEGGVVNAAGNRAGAVSPGAWVSLYGAGLSPNTASSDRMPAKLEGVTVYVNGFAAPVNYVSPGQINIQVPWELGVTQEPVPFTVSIDGPDRRGTRSGSPVNAAFSNTVYVPVAARAPGIFAIVHADGTLAAQRPAAAGDVLVIYATGGGPLDTAIPTGAPAPLDRLVRTQTPAQVNIGGVAAAVQFSGVTPGLVGVNQMNVQVPAGVPAGDATALELSFGGASATFAIPTR